MIKLKAIVKENINHFIKDTKLINNLINMYNSPLNIMFPANVNDNIKAFIDVFKKQNIRSKIFFAHKANKSSAIIKEMLALGINVDVASVNELKHVLACGFTADKIEATGPKNDEFLLLLLRHDILINVDNFSELELIINIHKRLNKKTKTKILIRLNGFKSLENKFNNKDSRFGININEKDQIFKVFQDNKDILTLKGFAFHLDTVSVSEKVIALTNIIELFNDAYAYDLSPSVINMGGGYKVNYLENKQDFDDMISLLKDELISGKMDNFWNNKSFGLRVERGTIQGIPNIYSYYDSLVKGDYLNEILSTKVLKFQNRTLGEILSENMIDLYIEPGRALLDMCGITIAEVNFVKKSAKGHNLVGLDMNSSNILMEGGEIFIDPILIGNGKKENFSCFIAGNLCLETDLIFKHKIYFDQEVKKGDYLVFVNTAGYFMDFSESESIMHNKATKIVSFNNNIYLDDSYDPLLIGGFDEN